jgi:hypothetical protein
VFVDDQERVIPVLNAGLTILERLNHGKASGIKRLAIACDMMPAVFIFTPIRVIPSTTPFDLYRLNTFSLIS